jgi:hypothetical protein
VKVAGVVFFQRRQGAFEATENQVVSAKHFARVEVALVLHGRFVDVDFEKSSPNSFEIFLGHALFDDAFVCVTGQGFVMAQGLE